MSDKQKKHRIEEFFRSNLKSHQEDPGPELWEDVSNNIPARPRIQTFFYSRKVLLVLAAICMFPLAYYGISRLELNDWFIETETIEPAQPTHVPEKKTNEQETRGAIAIAEQPASIEMEVPAKEEIKQAQETEQLAILDTPSSKETTRTTITAKKESKVKTIEKKATPSITRKETPKKKVSPAVIAEETPKAQPEEIEPSEFNKPLVLEMDDLLIELEVDEEYFETEVQEEVANGELEHTTNDKKIELEEAITLFNDLRPEDFNPAPPVKSDAESNISNKDQEVTSSIASTPATTKEKETVKEEIKVIESDAFDAFVLEDDVVAIEAPAKDNTNVIVPAEETTIEEAPVTKEVVPAETAPAKVDEAQFDAYVLNDEMEEEVEEVTLESILTPDQKAHRVFTEEERKVKNVYPHFSYSASVEPMLSIHKSVSSDVEVADRITNVGLYAGIQINEHLSVTTGVGFRHHDLNIDGTVDLTYQAEQSNPNGGQLSSYLIRPENNPAINLRSTIINDVQNDGQDIENGDQFAVDVSGSYRLKYHTIPVWLRYGFKEDKLSLNVKGGIQFHNLIGDKVRDLSAGVFDVAMNGSTERLTVDDSSLQVETVRDNFIEAGVGFGVNYALSKGVDVGIEPTVYKAVSPMLGKRPWSIGINAGITVRVDPQR